MDDSGPEQTNENPPENTLPIALAGFAGLLCLPIIYFATRPVVWTIHARWVYWPLTALFILFPMSVTFTILYRSLWHREWPGPKRILSLIVVSALVFCGALIMIALPLIALGLCAAGG
ncbi:MAG TPA: hypothetical protein VMF08_13345 [Candidatus Sulfotelmatobacter sp.]|nr:hypothetical protein [Candidatus Sulfotelmatobacter sp.]